MQSKNQGWPLPTKIIKLILKGRDKLLEKKLTCNKERKSSLGILDNKNVISFDPVLIFGPNDQSFQFPLKSFSLIPFEQSLLQQLIFLKLSKGY